MSDRPSPPTLAELRAAGLYDPDAPHADDRRALLAYLIEDGCTLDDLVRAAAEQRLMAAAADRRLRKRQALLDADEIAERAGVDPATIPIAWRALGFPDPPDDARLWWPSDAETFAAFGLAGELFGRDRVAQFSRALGRAASQVAEAAVALFLTHVQAPMESGAEPPAAIARANVEGQVAADAIPGVFETAFRHHLQLAIRRMDETTFTTGRERAVLCVGFADLVGSTELGHQLDPAGTARLAADLEQTATDTVARWSGRLVKTVGDGVLFTTTAAEPALAIAAELVAWAEGDPRLRGIRVGLTEGPVVWQDGDVYGPVVSLAARLTAEATGGQILVDAGLATTRAADARPRLEPAGRRRLRGFAEPVEVFAVVPTDPGATERAQPTR